MPKIGRSFASPQPLYKNRVVVWNLHVGAFTASVVVLVTPHVAERVAVVFTATGNVVIVKVAVREPAAMVTLEGTFAAPVDYRRNSYSGVNLP